MTLQSTQRPSSSAAISTFNFRSSAAANPKFSLNSGGPSGQFRLNTASLSAPMRCTWAGRWSLGYTTTRTAPSRAMVGIVSITQGAWVMRSAELEQPQGVGASHLDQVVGRDGQRVEPSRCVTHVLERVIRREKHV